LNNYQKFIYKTRYARYLPDENRREEWPETVDRYLKFFEGRAPRYLMDMLQPYLMDMRAMPSMRALMTAGPALERSNVAGFNCAALACNYKECFNEALYVLMCGCGLGFSCEVHEVAKLPVVAAFNDQLTPPRLFTVQDSKEGWADALKHAVDMGYAGKPARFSLRKIRPAGARLNTFGGRASGPAPLQQLLTYAANLFKNAGGRQLTTLEVHDFMCQIGSVVVVGGVRRAAEISQGSLEDLDHRSAKAGDWWTDHPERRLSNNSAVYESKPTWEAFKEEWNILASNGSGERGIVNREALRKQASKYGKRSEAHSYLVNPCGEIILRPRQFCNLTEVVVRPDDELACLKDKVAAATMMGTMQAALTNYPYLSAEWRKNAEDEYLLGVSLTGIMDHPVLSEVSTNSAAWLECLHEVAVSTNKAVADVLGIKPAAAITTVKPSGTVSQLVNSSSGIHVRYFKKGLRTVRLDVKDPVCQLLAAQGVYTEPCAMNPESTTVAYFPLESPVEAKTRTDTTLLQQLEIWLHYKRYWCDHTPSCSVYVGDDEWDECAAWVYAHFDEISGLSFFPKGDHVYKQAPYQELTDREFAVWLAAHPQTDIDWSRLPEFELEDATTSSQEVACAGGQCEL
jgi:ribonucleoside-diphosphate reductase alpha chain